MADIVGLPPGATLDPPILGLPPGATLDAPPQVDPATAGIPTQFATGIVTPRAEREQALLEQEGPSGIARIKAAFAEPFQQDFGLTRETIEKFKSPGSMFNTFNEVLLGRGVSPAVALLEAVGATTDAAIDGIAQIAREAGASKTSAESFKRDAKAILLVGGLLAGQPRGQTIPKIPKAPRQVEDVIAAGQRAEVPVLTTDVIPPKTFVGRITQSTAEKIPIIGTGNVRAAQQAKRQDAITNLALEQGVDLDSAFDVQIIKSLGDVKNANKAKAVGLRSSSVNTLNTFGDVDVPNTLKAIDDEIVREVALRQRADPKIIANLNEVKDAVIKGDFAHVGNIRTTVINDVKALQKGDFAVLPSKAEAGLQRVKSAIDRDMREFAIASDRQAAADWIKSNRLFADEFTKFRNSELKRLISKGELTPEVVNSTIFGGKRSELNRLFNNLDKQGRSNVRSAIIQRALQKSGFPDDINPNNFLRALNQESTRKATKAFFRGPDDKALEGFKRLLEHTRRAQEAGITTPTGQQLIPLIAGGATVANPIATLGTAGTLGAAARIYESTVVRNSLLKLAILKPGTKAFTKAAAKTGALINSAVQAEKRQE